MFGGQEQNGRILLVEADPGQAALYADLIATHCPGLRIDVCKPDERALLEDNAGGADVAICSCGTGSAERFDVLRELLTLRPCLVTLVLVPAGRPRLADEALAVGAADVLLRAPGYLDQLALSVRKNLVVARARLAARRRAAAAIELANHLRAENECLRIELAGAQRGRATAATLPITHRRPVTTPRVEVLVGERAKAA